MTAPPTAVVLSALCAAAAVGACGSRRPRAADRLRAVGIDGHGGRSESTGQPTGSAPALGLLAAGGVAVTCVAGWLGLAVAAVTVGALVPRHRLGRPAQVDPADAVLFVDLLAAHLAAGADPARAVRSAGSVGGDGRTLGRLSAEVAAGLLAGLPPDVAWRPLAAVPGLAPVAAVCVRSIRSGSGCGAELRRQAARLRQRHERFVERRAARAGIWLVLPLGLCFLPAFVLLTVAPVALGLLPRLG